MRQRERQAELRFRWWGGRRTGAGRKPAPGRRAMPHRRRALHDSRCPAHVTLRATRGLPSLRSGRVFERIRRAFGAASDDTFRLLHFSVQSDHVHLVVEADDSMRLARGMQGLAIRVAKAVNRTLHRHGPVWEDRYHARTLATPREVRNVLAYVLNNWRKHVPGASGLDPCSSAAWFAGWRTPVVAPSVMVPVARARTWLARLGWRKHELLDAREGPRPPGGTGP
jgi:REP-associated tyrosine transposase